MDMLRLIRGKKESSKEETLKPEENLLDVFAVLAAITKNNYSNLELRILAGLLRWTAKHLESKVSKKENHLKLVK
jgi:hypothetical protein